MTETEKAVQIYLGKPSYYRELYERLLKEFRSTAENFYLTDPTNLPKWKLDVLDVLLILLKNSKDKRIPRKCLHRMIKDDLKK